MVNEPSVFEILKLDCRGRVFEQAKHIPCIREPQAMFHKKVDSDLTKIDGTI